jgi:hypothetical protein
LRPATSWRRRFRISFGRTSRRRRTPPELPRRYTHPAWARIAALRAWISASGSGRSWRGMVPYSWCATRSRTGTRTGSCRVELEEQVRASVYDDSSLVLVTTIGTPVDAQNVVNRHFKPLLKRAGLPDIRWHELQAPEVRPAPCGPRLDPANPGPLLPLDALHGQGDRRRDGRRPRWRPEWCQKAPSDEPGAFSIPNIWLI